MKSEYLLACESSCDETAFTIYDIKNNTIIVSIINSQIEIHEKNGGVIPELASLWHYKIIDALLFQVLKKARISLSSIDYFAATQGPGLTGALLIGFTFLKSLAFFCKKPFIPVNHLEGHIFSSFLTHKDIQFPYLCVSISGGHSTIYKVNNFLEYEKLGETRDDACGECFDKVAKLLGLQYPGGRYIEEIAEKNMYENSRNYTISSLSDGSISFSGLKTAVLYDIIHNDYYDSIEKKIRTDAPSYFVSGVATSVQYVISYMLEKWVLFHLKNHNLKSISIVGGVACNSIIARQFGLLCQEMNISLFIPERKYCCDNSDMIAFVASKKIERGLFEVNLYDQSIFNAIC